MKTLLALFVGFYLVGCSNPQDATDANFKNAIQDYFNKTQACISVNATFPYEHKKNQYKNKAMVLDELVKLEILISEDFIIDKEPAIKYSLTGDGKKISSLVRTSTLFSGETKFCYGRYRVEEVLNFSEPADMFGQKISKVNYTYKLQDIAQWAQNDLLQSKYYELRKDVDLTQKSEKDKAVLILTNKGWVHKHLFKKGI